MSRSNSNTCDQTENSRGGDGLSMDWNVEALMALRAVIAALLGAVIGWEREQRGREAGIRIYAAVSLGACVFGLVSAHVVGASDPTRIAAGVVTGVVFLG